MLFQNDNVKIIKSNTVFDGRTGKIIGKVGELYKVRLSDNGKEINFEESNLTKIPDGSIKPLDSKDLNQNIKDFENKVKDISNDKIARQKLKEFRIKYPFKEDPELIDTFDENQWKEFLRDLDAQLKKSGAMNLYDHQILAPLYYIENFKEWISSAIDDKLTLAEKLDVDWEEMKEMGGDHILAKKIIQAFDDDMIPIFKTKHLISFYKDLFGKKPATHGMSDGEKYQYISERLIEFKESVPEMKEWSNIRFMGFLYDKYDPRES